MLARTGEPFDSPDFMFEIKWDGIRAVALVEDGDYRLFTRNRNPIKMKYPEVASIAALPSGTALDGELVALRDGMPDFELILRREQVRSPETAQRMSRTSPALFMVFDLLYHDGGSIMGEPLRDRRSRLRETLEAGELESVILSEAIAGSGKAIFRELCERGLEGMVAKRLDSPYVPGRRSDSWRKIKRRLRAHCVIIGYIEKEGGDFQSLLVATNSLPGEASWEGLRYVGRVGSGFGGALRGRLCSLLARRLRPTPVVPCREKAIWVEPELFCTVSFNEITEAGVLRAPVFEELIEE
jgi:DNA ligase D-like protein (predicted ligase)